MGDLLYFPKARQGEEVYLPMLQVQDQLGVSRRTLERWISEGMQSRLIEGRRRVRLSDARAWHANRKQAREAG